MLSIIKTPTGKTGAGCRLAIGLLCISTVCAAERPQGSEGESVYSRYFQQPARRPAFAPEQREPCADRNPLNNAYFGELHVHTGLSADAYAFGSLSKPDDAYRFARGETIGLPPYDGEGNGTRPVSIDRPLDFTAVTDHAEYLGEEALCLDEDSDAYDHRRCRALRGEDLRSDMARHHARMLALVDLGTERSESLCGPEGERCVAHARGPWDSIQRSAERWYDRSESCDFTTFVAYEYSLAEQGSNLHRNVIFANATVPPLPLSAKEKEHPEGLWRWLKDSCIDSGTGCDALAIPHNSNWSSGRMFYPQYSASGKPEDEREAAALRGELEPLVEIMQVKGDSECRQGLYGVEGSVDEYCDFEKLRPPQEPATDCKDEFGSGGMMLKGCISRWSYARYGLIQGQADQLELGVNPLKYGLIAATDSHLATSGAVSEESYPGGIGAETSPRERLRGETNVPGVAKGSPVRYNPGGLAGVWAPENSREALFAAMQRRETFGTSGPRIRPRLFGGWSLPQNMCDADNLAEQGYAAGVPMGGDLPPRPSADAAPVFVANALRDAADSGAPLQRIQIVKGWMDADGVMQQEVFDIAGGDNDASVDTATCERSGSGHSSLCGVWRDPNFDPDQAAVYYARILENPSCRWSTYQCNQLPPEERPASCEDSSVPKTVQERAWTSPIWYQP